MSKIYIRKVNGNEIGIRKGGKSKRAGSFLMVSKKCISFFPFLDPKVIDDSVQISMISPNGRETILIEYVYHNKKLHPVRGTRNEYRLYFSRELDSDSYIEPDDLVLMKWVDHKGFKGIKLFLLKKGRDNDYKTVNKLIKDETHYLTDSVGIKAIDNFNFVNEIQSHEKISFDIGKVQMKEKTDEQHDLNGDILNPSASSMIENLRSLGYRPTEAVADIIDNSISAKATNVWVDIVWNGGESYIAIKDDGLGMSENELVSAMRPGSKNPRSKRASDDLGRFGMGMKSAAFSIGKQLTVITKKSDTNSSVRRWDLDQVRDSNSWKVLKEGRKNSAIKSSSLKDKGTVVLIEELDRLLTLNGSGNILSDVEFYKVASKIEAHISLVFHRFLNQKSINIFMNGKPVKAFNPHFGFETKDLLYEKVLEDNSSAKAKIKSFIVPYIDDLPVPEQRYVKQNFGFTQLQGVYIYRGDRLISLGGWLSLGKRHLMKISDEYSLGRLIVELGNDSDASWRVDIKKTSAEPPLSFIFELQKAADIARKTSSLKTTKRQSGKTSNVNEEFWSLKNNKLTIDRANSLYRQIASDDEVGEKFMVYMKNLEKGLPQ